MDSVPDGFMRDLTRQRVESFAESKGLTEITSELVDEQYNKWKSGSNKVEQGMDWDEEALQRLQRIPDFVRGMVIKEVERCAQEMGAKRVGLEALNKAGNAWEMGGTFHSESNPDQYNE